MMDYLKKLNLTPVKVLKLIGLTLAGLIVIAVLFTLVSSTFRGLNFGNSGALALKFAPSTTAMSEAAMDQAMGGDYNVGLSVRNVTSSMPPVPDGTVPGNDAEDFEVKQYDATIETRHLDKDCARIVGLKSFDYVIFENANEYDRGCNYRFKVARDHAEEILAVIEELDPKDLSESAYTIKRQVEDFTSELDILQRKLDAIDSTLESAIAAYDEISKLAAQTRDAESLAKVIDSKIRIIEKLTTERLNVSAQIERLGRSKAEQLDRLDYTVFQVSVYENKFIDGEQLRDSWKAAVKDFLTGVNSIMQDLSVNLVGLILIVLQYFVYLLLLILGAKYGWQVIKWLWRK